MYANVCIHIHVSLFVSWCVSRMDTHVGVSIHPSIHPFTHQLENPLAPDSGSATEATLPPIPAARGLHTPVLAPIKHLC